MEFLPTHVYMCYDWIVRTTWQASALICLVLLIQWALRHRLNVRVRYLFWLVVLIRLAMPWMPQSRLSMYNLLPDSLRQSNHQSLTGSAYSAVTNGPATAATIGTNIRPANGSPHTDFARQQKLSVEHGLTNRLLAWLPFIWLTGTCLLGLYILLENIRIRRVIQRARPVTNPKILDILADCQRHMGTGISVRLVATDGIGSPALFGLIRPRLLLPSRTLAEMSRHELRYIFLHELAHLKHHDNLVSLIASILHVLHWFNPLIGYGFKRMHTDRELACDGKVLSLLHPEETAAYGDTIISQIELFLMSRSRPILATGFLGDRAQTRQRIAMISLFRRDTYRWSPLAIVIVAGLACIGLTNGCINDQTHAAPHQSPETNAEVAQIESPGLTRTLPALNHSNNTKRIYIRHIETDRYLVSNGVNVTCDAGQPGEAGLWEAHYSGEFTPDGDMTISSVASGKYLSTDDQGNLTVDQRAHDPRARWIRQAGPLGVQVISKAFKHGYLRLNEQGQVSAVAFGRDLRSQWDVVQLD